MDFPRKLAAILLAASAWLALASRLPALDDWGEAVDVAVRYQGRGYKKAAARAEQLLKTHQINGFVAEFCHDKDGEIREVSFQDKPEGFVVLVKDDVVQATRKLLRADIAAGLQVTLLHRSAFYPYRNTREFIRKNGSWDARNLAYHRENEENRKAMEQSQQPHP